MWKNVSESTDTAVTDTAAATGGRNAGGSTDASASTQSTRMIWVDDPSPRMIDSATAARPSRAQAAALHRPAACRAALHRCHVYTPSFLPPVSDPASLTRATRKIAPLRDDLGYPGSLTCLVWKPPSRCP